MAPSHKSAKWVFTEFANNTGYNNNGLVFFLGLLQAGWTLVGYECGAQIVEGTKNANRTAPRGIIICIISAIVQGFVLIIAVLFSIQDVEALQESSMPIATFFEAATNAKVATFFLVILLIVQLGSLCNSILATAHVVWAMARDGCLPFSSFLYKLSDKNHIPYNALMVQMVVSIVVIMPVSLNICYIFFFHMFLIIYGSCRLLERQYTGVQ
jgi:amino acid transporter